MYSSVTSVIRCSEQRYTLPGYSFSNCRLCVVITTDEPDSQMLCNNSTMDFACFHIQISGRLVCQDNSRRIEHGTCNHNALLFATGKFVRKFITFVGHSHQVEALLQYVPVSPVCFSSLWHEAQIPGYCIQYGLSAAESPGIQCLTCGAIAGYAYV